MATSEGIPSSIDIEFLELNDNPYLICPKTASGSMHLRALCLKPSSEVSSSLAFCL